MKKTLLLFVSLFIVISGIAQDVKNYKHDIRIGEGGMALKYGTYELVKYYFAPNPYIFYSYRIKNKFQITTTLSKYDGDTTVGDNIAIRHNSEPSYREYDHHYKITPGLAYEWINRGWFTLYSEVGCTFDFIHTDSPDRTDIVRQSFRVRPNITPIGVTFGRRLYFSAEAFSFGPRGFFNVGVGYKF